MGGVVEHDARRADRDTRHLGRDHCDAGHLPRHRSGPAGPGQHRLPAVDDPGLPAGHGRARGIARSSRRHVRPRPDVQPRLCRLQRGIGGAVARSVPCARRRVVAHLVARGPGDRRRDADGELGRDPDRRVPGEPAGHGPGRQPDHRAGRPVPRPGRRRPARRDRLARGLLDQRAIRPRRHDLVVSEPARDEHPSQGTRRLGRQPHVCARSCVDPRRDDVRHPAVRWPPDRLDQPDRARRPDRRCRPPGRVRAGRDPGRAADVQPRAVQDPCIRGREHRRRC